MMWMYEETRNDIREVGNRINYKRTPRKLKKRLKKR